MPEETASAAMHEGDMESTRPAPRKFGRPQGRRNAIIVIVVVVLIIGGIFLWRYFGSYESTDDAQVDVHLSPVSARVSGYVTKVNVNDNQSVQQGDVLVEIDPTDYEVAVKQAQANLANAEATAQALNVSVPITAVNTANQLKVSASDVDSAQAGIKAAEERRASAHAQVEQAQANDVKVQDDLQRYKLLADKREVAQRVYDQALAAAKASSASVAAAHANENAAQNAIEQAHSVLTQAEANQRAAGTGPQQVSSSQARARAAIADVQQKRALLDQAKLNLSYTKVVAPVSGEVTKSVVVGLNVQSGQQLLTIVPLGEVWITANFKETQLKNMQLGQKVEIHADATGRSFKGHVDSISGATGPLFSLLPPENATGNYVKIVQRIPVKIVLEQGENQDHQLRPGMNVVPDVSVR